MVVTLSDYILEQEVSTASCDDIVLEQLQAQIDVNLALANAYLKEYMMLEYASVYTEADESNGATTEKKSGKFKEWIKKVWEAIKGFFVKIGTKIKQFVRWIKTKIGGDAPTRLRKLAEKGSEEDCKRYVVAILNEFAKKSNKIEQHLSDLKPLMKAAGQVQVKFDELGLFSVVPESEEEADARIEKVVKGGDAINLVFWTGASPEMIKNMTSALSKLMSELSNGLDQALSAVSNSNGDVDAIKSKLDAIDLPDMDNFFTTLGESISGAGGGIAINSNKEMLKYMADGLEYYLKEGLTTLDKFAETAKTMVNKLDTALRSDKLNEISPDEDLQKLAPVLQNSVATINKLIDAIIGNAAIYCECIQKFAFKTFKPKKNQELDKTYEKGAVLSLSAGE